MKPFKNDIRKKNKKIRNKIDIELNSIMKSLEIQQEINTNTTKIETYLSELNHKNHSSINSLSYYINDLENQLLKFGLLDNSYNLNEELISNWITNLIEYMTYNFLDKYLILNKLINIIYLLIKNSKLNYNLCENLIVMIFRILDFNENLNIENILIVIYKCYNNFDKIKIIILKYIDNFSYEIKNIYSRSINIRIFSTWIFFNLTKDISFLTNNQLLIIKNFIKDIYNTELEFINIKFIICTINNIIDFDFNYLEIDFWNNTVLNCIEFINNSNKDLLEVSIDLLISYTYNIFNNKFFDKIFLNIILNHLKNNDNLNIKTSIFDLLNNLLNGNKNLFSFENLNLIFEEIIICLNFEDHKNLKFSSIFFLANIFSKIKFQILANLLFNFNNIFLTLFKELKLNPNNEVKLNILNIIIQCIRIGEYGNSDDNEIYLNIERNNWLIILEDIIKDEKDEEIKKMIILIITYGSEE